MSKALDINKLSVWVDLFKKVNQIMSFSLVLKSSLNDTGALKS